MNVMFHVACVIQWFIRQGTGTI